MLSTELSDRDFRRFSALVYEKSGINLHEGKKELVRARLAKRLRETGFRNFNAYYRFVTQQDSGTISVSFTEKSILAIVSNMFGEEMKELNEEIKDIAVPFSTANGAFTIEVCFEQ